MKKLNCIFLLFCLLSLYSCQQVFDINNKLKEDESLSESNFKTINIDGLYSLEVPNYMKVMPNLHPEASLKYANIYKEAYVIVIHESKQDFISLFEELNEYDSALSPVDNYTKVQKKMFDENLNNVSIQDYNLTSISDMPAKHVRMSGNVDGLDIAYVISFIEGPNNMYMIMSWTLKNRIERFENTFELVNSSFKII